MNNKTLAIIITAVATTLAATWLYCWYNKDRYQRTGERWNVFDKNTGTHYTYSSDGKEVIVIDFPSARRDFRKLD